MTATSEGTPDYATSFSGNAAENYERYFVASIGNPMANLLLEATDIRDGDRVLDIACGTGVVARKAADRVGEHGSVAGVDINPGMLAVARSIAAAAGQSIRWYESGAEAIPLPDESFDLAVCQLGLMFVPNRAAALREMRRVLSDGGRVAIGVPRPNSFFQVLDDGLASQVDPAVAAFVETVFALGEPRIIEQLLGDAELRDVDVRVTRATIELPPAREFMWQYIHSTPLAEFTARASAPQRARLERDVTAGWKPWTTETGGMRYEQELLVATARKGA